MVGAVANLALAFGVSAGSLVLEQGSMLPGGTVLRGEYLGQIAVGGIDTASGFNAGKLLQLEGGTLPFDAQAFLGRPLTITGLKPGGEFGFHIHEAGDCSSGDGMSAKGHFNPYGKQHAHAGTPERHAGDLPSLKADGSGNANVTADLDVITVSAGPGSVVGRGLIVHAQPDDFKTQPTGNAGARSACAVIKAG